MRKSVLLSRLLLLALLFGATAARSDTVVVTNTNDNLAGSLRQMIQDAAPGDTIVFQMPTAGTRYSPETGVYSIGLESGELMINKDLTIDGSGAKIEVARSGPPARIFTITGGSVTFLNLTIRSGSAGGSVPPRGAGIYNKANLVLRNCSFVNNGSGSELGGAINNEGTLVMTNCTLNDNNALQGAGIYNQGDLTVRNCTIAGNRAGDGGNSAGVTQAAGVARVRSTIIAQNGGDTLGRVPDVGGSFVSEGYNFIGASDGSTGFGASGSHDQVGSSAAPANPAFVGYGRRGGLTPTFGLRAGSPAIDQGISGDLTGDQRGFPRVFDQAGVANAGGGDGTDIGSVESGAAQGGSSFTVTNVDDHADPFGDPCTTDDCTLREALAASNANADANTILFAAGVTGIIPALTANYDITAPVTINGPGARLLALSGMSVRRVLVASVGPTSISRLTIANGLAGSGGAIYAGDDVSLTDCTVRDNVATANGGAIYLAGGLRDVKLLATGCTFSGNRAQQGGAVFGTGGSVTAINSTFSGNTASTGRGGAIDQDGGRLTLVTNCTIAGNTNTHGALALVGGSATLANTIVAGNGSAGAPAFDLEGTFVSEGHNFIGKRDGSTGFTDGVNADQVGTNAAPKDPQLGPLQYNGGPTDTRALLAGSTAINAGDDSRARTYDQRSFSRVGLSDIGAVEFGGLQTALANISTRIRVGSGDNALIGGFIVTGTEPKRLIARAIGPSTGVPCALTNPQLEVFNAAGGLIGFSDNWQDAPNRQEIIDTGIAPPDNAESAVVGSVQPGAYTAVVRGVGGETGIGIVDIYDLDRPADSRLANISTRGVVGTGDDVMIAGFIVVGARSQNTLLRAIGPSLPISGNLPNPLLEIYNGDGVLLASNDNWRATQEAEVIATGIPPTNDLEAAIVGDAPPGAYTAIVRGVGGTTGIATIEVYALD